MILCGTKSLQRPFLRHSFPTWCAVRGHARKAWKLFRGHVRAQVLESEGRGREKRQRDTMDSRWKLEQKKQWDQSQSPESCVFVKIGGWGGFRFSAPADRAGPTLYAPVCFQRAERSGVFSPRSSRNGVATHACRCVSIRSLRFHAGLLFCLAHLTHRSVQTSIISCPQLCFYLRSF